MLVRDCIADELRSQNDRHQFCGLIQVGFLFYGFLYERLLCNWLIFAEVHFWFLERSIVNTFLLNFS